MCGIAGFVSQIRAEEAEHKLGLMAQALYHRGPDSRGHYFDAPTGVGFSHTRLSIIDLSLQGHQPMKSRSGRFVITYNGEIYNFREMAKKLSERGYEFKGHSDTEVLVNYIEAFGLKEALSAVCGMFAFALYDSEKKKIYLARDPVGEKPLYYSLNGENLFFASELKALQACDLWGDAISPDSLGLFMLHNYIPAPHSIYQNTFKLPAGSYIEFCLRDKNWSSSFSPFKQDSSSYKVKPRPYWSLSKLLEQRTTHQIEPNHALEILETELKNVISEQMVSDVPLGAFLSGGIDSSLVVALMQSLSSRPVKTFSIGFSENQFNEAPHAKAVAKHLGTEHTELYVTPKQAMDIVPKLAQIYDEPFADSSQIPTHILSQLARGEVTVSLSGDGGDELFGGYNRYFLATSIWNKMKNQPAWFKKISASIIKSLEPSTWDAVYSPMSVFLPQRYKFKLLGDKLYKATKVLEADNNLAMYLSLISHWDDVKNVVPEASQNYNLLSPYKDNFKNLDFKETMMALDLETYLTDDILTKVDRAAMAVSLETRIPILDKRIIELAWSFPIDLKIKEGVGKWPLRQILYKYVPKELIERPKMGFGVPVENWIKGPLLEWAEDLLSEAKLAESGWLDATNIRYRWSQHKSGKQNWQASLWNVLMFQQWRDSQK